MKSIPFQPSTLLKLEVWLLVLGFILPSLILYLDLLPRSFFFPVLGGLPLLVLVFYTLVHRIPPRQLGLSINGPSIKASLVPTAYVMLIGGLGLAVLPWLMGEPRRLYIDPDYYGWYLGMAIFQEVIWRGLAILLLKKVMGHHKHAVILASAALFAFSHIYFRSLLIVLGTGLLGGLWGQQYWQYKSISGPALSHYVVGCAFILLNYMGGHQTWQLL